jgi:hypothetical protein
VVRKLAVVALAGIVVIPAAAKSDHIEISVGMPRARFADFARVLVAGFVTSGVPQVDGNVETARLLGTELRSKRGLTVVNFDPLDLQRDLAGETEQAAASDEQVFKNVPFWKQLGEEYAEPLIVTGTVGFMSAGHRMEERSFGRRTIRLWHPGFTLMLRLVLIDGRTGRMIESVPVGKRSAFATADAESPLALYFKLMEEAMPSVLDAFARGSLTKRVLLQ